MPSLHFSAFVSLLQKRGGTPRGHSGSAAAGLRKWRLRRCFLWIVGDFFLLNFRANQRKIWKIFSTSDDPKGSRDPCTHICPWWILQAFPKMWGRGRKRKHWLSKPKQRLCHWVPLLGSGKISGKWLFFSLLFFNKCGKHDFVANCKLNTRSDAAVIGGSILIGPVRKQLR